MLKGNEISAREQKALSQHLQIEAPIIEFNSEGLIGKQSFRFPNELARHKLLDLIGDLALLGKPLRAHITSIKPGHASNILFAKKVRRVSQTLDNGFPDYHPNATPVMDIHQIKKRIPHRYPLLLVDKIFYLSDTLIGGIKNFTYNELFFQGHFPENPVMPGVLQIEALAQVGALFITKQVPDPDNYWTYLLALKHVRFKRPVRPGDTLVIYCRPLHPLRSGVMTLESKGYINRKLILEGVMSAMLVRKDTN